MAHEQPPGTSHEAPKGSTASTPAEAVPPVNVEESAETAAERAATLNNLRENAPRGETHTEAPGSERKNEAERDAGHSANGHAHPRVPGFFEQEGKKFVSSAKNLEVLRTLKAGANLIVGGAVAVEAAAIPVAAAGYLVGALGFTPAIVLANGLAVGVIAPGVLIAGAGYGVTWFLSWIQRLVTGSAPKAASHGSGGGSAH